LSLDSPARTPEPSSRLDIPYDHPRGRSASIKDDCKLDACCETCLGWNAESQLGRPKMKDCTKCDTTGHKPSCPRYERIKRARRFTQR